MKLQIDAIVTKSQALKSESNSEQYNRQLTDNGMCTRQFFLCEFLLKLTLLCGWHCRVVFAIALPETVRSSPSSPVFRS